MANFQKKIQEMQRKLNIINEDIEEIKNERKSYDKNHHKIIIDKTNSFLNPSKRKNFFKDNINNNNNINNNSLNYIHRKYPINSQNSSNLINIDQMGNQNKNTNFKKIINENLEQISTNNYFISGKINNTPMNIQINEMNPKKDLTINYINDYTNKKNINGVKKYKSSLSSMSFNNGKQLNFKYSINHSIDNKDNKENEYDEYFLKNNSLYQNYCHMKNLNNLNKTNLNNYINSQTINNNISNINNIIHKNNKTFNNGIKDINIFSSIKGNKRIKKMVDKKKKNITLSNKNFFNNEFSKINSTKNKNNIYNNNHKTIDIGYNYSYNHKNQVYDNENNKENGPIKIKTRNTNYNNNIINNDIINNNKILEKTYTSEDINFKNQRSNSIDNPKIKFPINSNYKYNKNLKINIVHNFKDNPSDEFQNKINRAKTEKIEYTNNNNENNENNENNSKHEKLLLDIIDVTNKYNNSNNKINMDNILDEYKLLLYDNKIKNEFIYKIIKLYNNSTNSNLKYNNNESLIPTWHWIKDIQNKVAYNKMKKETENNQYKKLCKDIMKEYKLKNIEQLKVFIHKLCKKIDKNENFLEGIKKILLP